MAHFFLRVLKQRSFYRLVGYFIPLCVSFVTLKCFVLSQIHQMGQGFKYFIHAANLLNTALKG